MGKIEKKINLDYIDASLSECNEEKDKLNKQIKIFTDNFITHRGNRSKHGNRAKLFGTLTVGVLLLTLGLTSLLSSGIVLATIIPAIPFIISLAQCMADNSNCKKIEEMIKTARGKLQDVMERISELTNTKSKITYCPTVESVNKILFPHKQKCNKYVEESFDK